MTDKGEAYMATLKSMQMVPTTAERFLTEWMRVNVTKVRTAMKTSSKKSQRKTLSLLVRSE